MFKNEFQGGQSLDVFSVHGKDPLSKLKIHGPSAAVKKEFDNDLRTFILALHGDAARSKIAFPKSGKQTLHLSQQYLVFQIFLQSGQSFSLEIAVVTQSNLKLRLILSSSNREIAITAHHVKMPCLVVKTDTWLNLCIDLKDIVLSYFEGNHFSHVDSLVVSANCKLKKIFTLKEAPVHPMDIPKTSNFPSSIPYLTQLIDYKIFDDANIGIRSGTGNPAKRTPLNASNSNSIAHENTHIAFGSRVRSGSIKNNNNNNEHTTPEHTDRSQPATQRHSSRSAKNTISTKSNYSIDGSKDRLEPSLTSRGINILPSKPASKSANKVELDANNNEIVASNNDVTTNSTFQPRPPDKNVKKCQNNIRRLRTVKSADVKSRANSRTAVMTKQQVFSKSADSRNRRRPSITDNDKILPAIVKVKKGISRSAFHLEKSEKEISENRELHFKSKSLSVLPKIGSNSSATRNNRYGKSVSISQEEEDQEERNEMQNENDNVFVQEEEDEDKNEELMALADENEVDDYLKLRTRSSCREDESASYSSCNSTNSDLFLYSSRPRSVLKQRTESLQKSKPRSRAASKSKSRSNSRSNADNVDSKLSNSTTGSNNNNETFTVSPQANMVVNETTDNSKKENIDEAIGVDLSWEYSESTSMLVIPKELKQDGGEDRKVPFLDIETTAEFSSEESIKNREELAPVQIEKQRSDQEFSTENGKSEATTTTTTSSGIISDLSNDDQNNNNLVVKENNEKGNSNLIHSSYVMRESCDSDSMSWLQDSQDLSKHSVSVTSTLDKMKSPNVLLRQRLLKEQLGSLIVQSKDVESESDGMSECSDDTTYTDLPPKRFRNYRYQDEIQSLSSTLDLSATIPATPRVEEQARSDRNNNEIGGNLDETKSEELLDLMYDAELNCYFDPVTHKYYELN